MGQTINSIPFPEQGKLLARGAPDSTIREYINSEGAEFDTARMADPHLKGCADKWRTGKPQDRANQKWSEDELEILRGLVQNDEVWKAASILRRSPVDVQQAVAGLKVQDALKSWAPKSIATGGAVPHYLIKNWYDIERLGQAVKSPSIIINGKNYTRLLDQAMAIVRAKVEIVAEIGK